MSVSVLCDEHIHVLITAALSAAEEDFRFPYKGHVYYIGSSQMNNMVGQHLVDQNYRSFNKRYGSNDQPHKYKFEETAKFSPVEVLKACDCYEYQACEDEGWDGSLAKAFIGRLKDTMVRKLPGYEEAPWMISPETKPKM